MSQLIAEVCSRHKIEKPKIEEPKNCRTKKEVDAFWLEDCSRTHSWFWCFGNYGPSSQVPFAARALVGTILSLAMVEPVTIHCLLDDFCAQFADLSTRLKNIMQTAYNTFIVHCYLREHTEWLLASGLTFRTHLIAFKPAANTQWVKLTRVRYGITENAIKSQLSDFGTVLKIRHEKIRGIGISVYSVKIDLKKPIPSRITIAQSPVNVFYRGQVQQCFRCEQTGHLSWNCPLKTSARLLQSPPFPLPAFLPSPPPLLRPLLFPYLFLIMPLSHLRQLAPLPLHQFASGAPRRVHGFYA